MRAPGTTDTRTLVGQVLAQRYQLLEVLGVGGMASVFLGQHITLGKRVAIKVLHQHLCGDRIQVDRFLREARAASSIGHDHVVDILDFGNAPGGSVFYAMEYLDGEDLAALLRREGRVPWARVRGIMLQVTRALAAAHDGGVVHRDLKPANCFLVCRPDGRDFIKVLDFGIARVTDPDLGDDRDLTKPGAIFGTAKYMAPEQACGRQADARTDVYAAGICMYELLTGSVPYDGDCFMRVLNRHLTEPLTPPTTMAPEAGITLTVEAVILKALAKDPAARYQTMRELGEALAAIDLDGNLAYQPDPGPPSIAADAARPNTGPNAVCVARPNTGPRTGTVVLGPLPAAPPPAPTMFLAPHDAGCTPDPTGYLDPVAGTRPDPVDEPTTPPAPQTCPPPPAWTAGTISAPPRSRLGVALAVVLGLVLAVGAGALTAWLLILRPADAPPSVAVDAPPVVAPAVLTERPPPVLAQFQLAPPPPRPVVAKPDPEPEPEPSVDPPEPAQPKPTRRAAKRHRTADHRTAIDIARGFTRARNRVKACLGDADPTRIRVLATVRAAGDVIDVHVVGTATPSLAACVKSAVREKASFVATTRPLDGRYWTYHFAPPPV